MGGNALLKSGIYFNKTRLKNGTIFFKYIAEEIVEELDLKIVEDDEMKEEVEDEFEEDDEGEGEEGVEDEGAGMEGFTKSTEQTKTSYNEWVAPHGTLPFEQLIRILIFRGGLEALV
ncbi:Hypothetical predicted protein [Paramuricea clavata]|uniref:Uncharacterized protein n=1 Tax=Paramuricea clavata TaxID=317549 RepID=A0A6S7JLA9_PARCT|nr:Hypothetical predicted protein [Paramuricea clavata]